MTLVTLEDQLQARIGTTICNVFVHVKMLLHLYVRTPWQQSITINQEVDPMRERITWYTWTPSDHRNTFHNADHMHDATNVFDSEPLLSARCTTNPSS